MCEITNTFKCKCGAVTVQFDNDATNSMPAESFTQHFPEEEEPTHIVYNCDYCVNHWGIDLCGCGSGEKVGECTNEYAECRSSTPAQYLEQVKYTSLWAR